MNNALFRLGFKSVRTFAGDTKSDIIASRLKTDPPPLVHDAESVPRELEHIVNRPCPMSREDRYEHIKDLLIDLKDCKQEFEFLSAGDQRFHIKAEVGTTSRCDRLNQALAPIARPSHVL